MNGKAPYTSRTGSQTCELTKPKPNLRRDSAEPYTMASRHGDERRDQQRCEHRRQPAKYEVSPVHLPAEARQYPRARTDQWRNFVTDGHH